MVFHLPLRQTEGFLCSLADLLEVELPIPDHTTLSRRPKKLGDTTLHGLAKDGAIHAVLREPETGLFQEMAEVRRDGDAAGPAFRPS